MLSDAKQFVGKMSAKKVAVHRRHSHLAMFCILSFVTDGAFDRKKRRDPAVVRVASACGALWGRPTYVSSSLTLPFSTPDTVGG